MVSGWRDRAACAGLDPEMWFPLHTGGRGGAPSPRDREHAEPAVRVCRGCPVRRDCLTWAVEGGEQHGIWGGMLPYDRAQHAQEEGTGQAPPADATGDELRRMVEVGFAPHEIARVYNVRIDTVRRWLKAAPC